MFLNKFKEPMKRICGVDLHRSSIFVCILDEDGIYQNKFGVLTPERLTEAIYGRTVNKWGREVIRASLTGMVGPADFDTIRQLKEEIELRGGIRTNAGNITVACKRNKRRAGTSINSPKL